MKFAMVLVVALFITGCTKEKVKEVGNTIACTIQESVVVATTAAVVTELSCSNSAAIKTYLTAQADKLKICKKEEETPVTAMGVTAKSAIGDLICAPMVETLAVGALATIPAEWGCTGGQMTAEVKAKLLAACQKAL